MLSIQDEIVKIQKTQKTITALLLDGILSKENEHYENKKKDIRIDILFQNEATIGIGTMGGKGMMTEHQHDTKHYLICLSGRFIVKFLDSLRVIGPGDCVSIPQDTPHKTQCVHAGKLAFINVPADNTWGDNGRVH